MIDLKNSEYFFNRELSWLKFNSRVLSESKRESVPTLERLKFIAIYGTNLDEFYMVRVAGLKQLYSARVTEAGPDKMSTKDQLYNIREYLHDELYELESCYESIIEKLKDEGLILGIYDDLDSEQKQKVDSYFFTNIFPVIIPIAVDATHPFPHLNNLSFALALKLQDSDDESDIKFGMIRIPRVLPRFIQAGKGVYITIESLVQRHIENIFPGFKLLSSVPFRVTRNADLVIEDEEADDLMEILEQGLRQRKKGAIVRVEVGDECDDEILYFLQKHLKISQDDIYFYKIPLNQGALWQIISNKEFSNLLSEPYTPKTLPPLNSDEDIFEILDKNEALIIQPYESFDPITRLIQSASKDPNVLSIRMTLYRVEKNSAIIQSLLEAANDGKQVTVMVELKARFDEENNLNWAKMLEDAGAHVIFGIPGFKVHAKATQIIKQVNGDLKFYMHLGTGNYNASTAKIYTDIHYLTSKKEIAEDMTKFFHILSGFSKEKKLNNLYLSPTQIKNRLLALIDNEASLGQNGKIILKANSLVDPDVIEALYKASSKGVKIDLIIRGICTLVPDIPEVSENINVISIVGKYLEHPRIYYFKHALPQVYISSADLMPRNLERRIELMTPIENKLFTKRIIDYLELQLLDNDLSWRLDNKGEYHRIKNNNEQKSTNSQLLMEEFTNKLYQKYKKDSEKSIIARRLFKES
jgi:polyphosphate kinase